MFRKLISSLLVLAAVPLALWSAESAFYAVAGLSPNAAVFAAAAALACLVTAGLVTGIALRLWGLRRPLWWALVASGALTLILGAVAGVAIFLPASPPLPESRAGTEYWELPTGSRLAYVHFPAVGEAQATPIVILHGGPGLPFDGASVDYYGQLAQDGFEVYVYDQIGAGLSSRLSNVRAYTVQRNVDDLEAIRLAIGAERVILIGASWGGTLAAHYLASHADHVEKAIAIAPAQLMGARSPRGASTVSRTAARAEQAAPNFPPRFEVAYRLMTEVSPEAALSLMSQDEFSVYMAQWVDPGISYCRRDAAKAPATFQRPGYNALVTAFTLQDLSRAADIRPALASVATPVLILRGECDYMDWEITREYRQLLPNATLLYLEGGGHALTATQPDAVLSVMRAFLRNEPLPIEPYTGETDPAGS